MSSVRKLPAAAATGGLILVVIGVTWWRMPGETSKDKTVSVAVPATPPPAAAAPAQASVPTESPSAALPAIPQSVGGGSEVDPALDQYLDRAIQDQMSIDAHARQKAAVIAGMGAKSHEEAAKIYEENLRLNPLGPGAIPMMSRLAYTYTHLGRTDEAESMLADAIVQAGPDRYVNTLKVNLAWVYMMKGDLAAAESELRNVMNLPIPGGESVDAYEIVPQAFLSRKWLAEVYRKQGKVKDADEILKQAADTALSVYAQNNLRGWAAAYYVSAFDDRITLLQQTDPENKQAAQDLRAEMEQNVPSWNEEVILAASERFMQAPQSAPAVSPTPSQ